MAAKRKSRKSPAKARKARKSPARKPAAKKAAARSRKASAGIGSGEGHGVMLGGKQYFCYAKKVSAKKKSKSIHGYCRRTELWG